MNLFVRRIVSCRGNRSARTARKAGSLLLAMVTSSVLIAAAQASNTGMMSEKGPVGRRKSSSLYPRMHYARRIKLRRRSNARAKPDART